VVGVDAERRRSGGIEARSARGLLAWSVVILLLAVGVLGTVALIGALLRERPPLPRPLGSNGLVVVSANPWDFGGGENGDIYVVEDGASPRRIIGSAGDAVAQECPWFSPDGARLAYGEARASGPVTTYRGVWPVGGRAVVVVGVGRHGDPSGPPLRVGIPGTGPMVCPEWSPDGQLLAFRVADRLWIADAESGETREVPIINVSGREDMELEWSRDGSMIAVAEPGQIRVVHVDGTAPMLIRVTGAAPRSVGWSADDERIVYVSTVPVDEIGSAVRVVDVDGTNDRSLTQVADAPAGVQFSFNEAAVSPDGRRVAYLQDSSRCTSDGCGPGPKVEPIAVSDLDGSDRVELPIPAAAREARGPDGSDFFASSLRWSPDGERLLLSSIAGVVSVGPEPGSPTTVYATGAFGAGLNLEWSSSQVTWQPVAP
jgi:Tol biopolymer transport system component